jgi:signal transduction histidine kinase
MAETGVHFDAPLHSFPLVYQTETIGELQVAARSLNELLSEADERVLRQVALQAGTAVHAIRLTHDLQQSRIRLVTTREEERRRLRRDLHDELGPLIASQGLKLAAVRELMGRDPETAVRLLDDVLAKNQNTVADVRRLVYNLRPPSLDELGLVGAIREHVQNSEQSGLKTTIIAPPDGLPPLSAAVEAAAYRIVLEAFTNVVRHAEARSCWIELKVGEIGDWRLEINKHPISNLQSLILQIQDDGVGLRENGRHGIGLTSMRERAEEVGGSCEVVSSGKGVRVTAVLPIEDKK